MGLIDDLRELTQMMEKGALTEDEFVVFKRKLMTEDDDNSENNKLPSKRAKPANGQQSEDEDVEDDEYETRSHHSDTVGRKRSSNSSGTSSPRNPHTQTRRRHDDSPPQGSWVCSVCQNLNYPTRTFCNRKGCGLPRVQVDATLRLPAWNIPAAMPVPPTPIITSTPPPGMVSLRGISVAPMKNETPAGSWVCSECSNVNWPIRSVCNRCHANRSPSSLLFSDRNIKPGNPAGSWICPSCGNVNWPQRTHCNRKHCDEPRPEPYAEPGASHSNPLPSGEPERYQRSPSPRP